MNFLKVYFKGKRVLVTSLLVACLIGLFIGYLLFGPLFKTGSYAYSSYVKNNSCVSGLTLIKPTLDCGISDQKLEQVSLLQNKLEILVDGYKKTGKADKVGVFVRDLRTTRFAGVNDNEVFIMASLLKLPVLIGGFKLAEVQPKMLEQTIEYTGSIDEYDEQNYKVGDKLQVGKKYTVLELLKRSIEYSDNTATQLVSNYFAPGYLDLILEALGIKIKDNGMDENLVTPRIYANVFRSLYNASYLTKEYSNQALGMLTQVKFKNGAVAKLPPDVIVAHKFAERNIKNAQTREIVQKQLHDCGIVYTKDLLEPYTFCIMTEGKDFNNLENILQEVSLEIYETMTSSEGGAQGE